MRRASKTLFVLAVVFLLFHGFYYVAGSRRTRAEGERHIRRVLEEQGLPVAEVSYDGVYPPGYRYRVVVDAGSPVVSLTVYRRDGVLDMSAADYGHLRGLLSTKNTL